MKQILKLIPMVVLLVSCAQVEENSNVVWKGAVASKLDQHSKLKTWKKTVTPKQDGSEEWTFRTENDESSAVKCDGVICSVDENPKVCNAVFSVSQEGIIVGHHLEGRCEVVGPIEPEK